MGVDALDFSESSGELNLNLDGWEGPLDLLLNLARAQKVDLAQISILQLVDQYTNNIANARALKLEIAADYLVMAAWLAYLKSCLLLPKDPEQDPSPEEVALRLQMRLQRLDAMREAGARLLGRDRINRDVFLRGAPEGLRLVRKSAWQVSPFELFAAYGMVKARTAPAMHVVHMRAVMTLDDAIARVSKMIGLAIDWVEIGHFLPDSDDPAFRRSALASSFVAALELARRGTGEPPRLFARSPKEMRQIGRSLEMPAASPLDELDPPARVDFGKRSKRNLHVALARVTLDFLDAERLGRSENGRLYRTNEFVHQAARNFSGANGPSWRMSSLPRRANSRAATKLDARAERR